MFTRLGHLIAGLNMVNTYRGTTATARVATIQGDYTSTDENLIANLYPQLTAAQNVAGGFASYVRTLAQQTVTQQVSEAITLPNNNFQTALTALVKYLNDNAQTVVRNTVGATVTVGGSNTGNGNVLAGVTSNLGVPLEFVFAEAINGVVTRDSVSSGAVAGQESLTFAGQFAVNDTLSYLFPGGSGATSVIQAINAGAYGGRGTANQLINGDFEGTWTSNVPANWHINVGTAGTSVLKSTAQHYDGINSLNFLGDGAEHTSLYTTIGTDTTAPPQPLDQLAVGLWLKVDSVPAAGVLSVELTDGSGTQLLDAAGNASAFTISLPGATTSWVAHAGFLRTPRVLPAMVRLQLRLSTALSNTINLFIDRVSMARPISFYQGGPTLAAFSGAVNWINGDSFTVNVTNSSNGLIQSGCNRLFNMRQSGLIFPSTTGTATILDSLVA